MEFWIHGFAGGVDVYGWFVRGLHRGSRVCSRDRGRVIS